jgi:Leucine-rich repeat (LRR) protein
MTTADGSAYTVDWGDGTSSTVASAANATRVYAGNYSGAIRIFSTGIFTRVNSWTGTVTLTGTTAQLPTGLTALYLIGSSITLTGTTAQLPTGLTILQLIGSSITLTGTTAQLPTGLTYLQLNGSSIAVTGTTAQLPTGLTFLQLNGNSIALTGTIAQLPIGLTTLYLIGSSIAVTGTTAQLPTGLTFLYFIGSSIAVTGTTAQLPTGLTYLYLSSNSITLTGSSTPWRTASMRHVYISAYGLATATDVDNLLIALSGVTSWITEKLVDLRGAGNAARTAASNAAVLTIQSYGVTVLTN